jgi:TetR/AcrR family transcriptional repressor of mexJK operon
MKLDDRLEHENAGRILEEGWKLFQQKGYRGVTLDALCLQCGITKPTLYYYFQDKETLFVAVLKHKLHGFREVMEQPGTLTERLQGVAAAIFESFQNEYTALLRDREHIKDPANLAQIKDAFHGELFGPLNTLMQAGIDQGELQGSSPDLLTLAFLGIINNFIGRAPEMGFEQPALASLLTYYFMKGVSKN